MNKIYLRQNLSTEEIKSGKITGVAYTGAVIKSHGFLQNLVIDLSTLTIKKEKTPLLRDHTPTQVAGHAKVVIGENVTIDGTLSKKSVYGQEIIDLSEDGFDWELSLGIFDGELVEFENEEYNGQMITHGVALKNGLLREVSVVALGADSDTTAEVFNVQRKGVQMKHTFTEESWTKFACACGGNKDSKPEELEGKFAENDKKVAALEEEIAALKEQVAAKQAEIDEAKAAEQTAARVASIKSAVEAKGIKLSEEKISEAGKTEEGTKLLLSVVEVMEVQAKKIDPKFAAKVDLGNGSSKVKADPESIRLAAQALVKEGKAKDFISALAMVEVENV